MYNFLKKTKNQEIGVVFLLYIFLLIIGFFTYKDFGVSVDEWELRILGFSNLKYIATIFFPNSVDNINNVLNVPDLGDYFGTHGAIFALPTAFIEYIFNIKDSENYYLLRHYLNHLIFLISTFYFFLLVKTRFDNWSYGFFAAAFLFFSPRIFAESFYNHKDIIFLSFFIISLYYGIKFYNFANTKNAIFFAIATALAIDIRIMGVIIIPIIITLTYFKNIEKRKKIFLNLLIFFSFLIFFTILFWPYLWNNPLANFIKVFKTLSSFGHEGYNFYFGEYHLASNTPWHYTLVWISITTPIFYLFLFFCGFANLTYKFFNLAEKYISSNKISHLFDDKSTSEDLIYYSLLILPIFIVIILNSTLYNGWRHIYFIYPCFLIIAINGLDIIKNRFFNDKKFYFNILVFVFLSHIIFSMYKYHPHQNVYFNFLAGKKVEKYFELDYWGLSNKQAFEYILSNDNKKIIKIGSAGPISLENSLQILNIYKRKRINISNNKNADYIINNYINWHKYTKKRHKIPSNFNIYKEIVIDNKRIISIYKKM